MTTPPPPQSEAQRALDQLGELIDQLASNAREFDFDTANRMERDAAKALLVIEATLHAALAPAGEPTFRAIEPHEITFGRCTTPAGDDEVGAIRGRHEEMTVRYMERDIALDGPAVPRAHTDRATLLRAYDAMRADNERLKKLIDDLTGPEPINQDEMGGCVWCGGTPAGKPYGYATASPEDHSSDCVWLEARAALNQEGGQ